MRILHFADLHLDRPFTSLTPDRARLRRQDLFDAFRRCLALAVEREVDLVTIGGDLWEEEHVRGDTRNSVAHELGQLGRPVLIVCGNHDPLLAGGSYMRTSWPNNVTIVRRGDLREHSFGDVSIWSVSWGGGDLEPRLLERAEAPGDGRTHILLVHGTSVTAPFADEYGGYFAFDPGVVERGGFTLCLAGHVHMASHQGRVVYPGSPEPLGWGEQRGQHCAAVVELDGGAPRVELVGTAAKRYETREVNCSGCASSAEVDAQLREVLDHAEPGNVFLRLSLVGGVGSDCSVDHARIRSRYRATYADVLIDDRTYPELDIEARATRKGLDGLFIQTLQQKVASAQTEEERDVLELALQAGLNALDGRKVILRVD